VAAAKGMVAGLVTPAQCNAILDSISEGVFTVDESWRLTSLNAAAERILGLGRASAIGRPCREVLRADICGEACALRYTLATGSPVANFAAQLTGADGRPVPVSLSTALLRDAAGRVVGAVETFRDLSQLHELRRALERRYTRHDIVSRDPRMLELLDLLPVVAASDSTVLIEGESGTGKELLARALHALSPRRGRPMVTVNCAAIPETLIESELFGHKAGAFTGATRDQRGKFSAADGGTLFLDEVGEMSAALQVKLLRALQERSFEPVGEARSTSVNVRVIGATNHDLRRDVAAGSFREDLFFRLNVIHLRLPPLRERVGDVPLLVEHFLAQLTAVRGKEVAAVTPEAMGALAAHHYPGNVRELQNAVEHAFVLCPGGIVGVEHLPEPLRRAAVPQGSGLAATLARFEAELIREALRESGWNRAAAARRLGVHRTTLFKKLRALGLDLPETDGRSRRGTTRP